MDQNSGQFHDTLKEKMDRFAHLVYAISRKFPKEELYGVTSQIRRAVLSVILNYIEGFARKKKNVYRNFLEISYGSLKETKYLLFFCFKEEYLPREDYMKAIQLCDEIGAMLWSFLKQFEQDQ